VIVLHRHVNCTAALLDADSRIANAGLARSANGKKPDFEKVVARLAMAKEDALFKTSVYDHRPEFAYAAPSRLAVDKGNLRDRRIVDASFE